MLADCLDKKSKCKCNQRYTGDRLTCHLGGTQFVILHVQLSLSFLFRRLWLMSQVILQLKGAMGIFQLADTNYLNGRPSWTPLPMLPIT